LFGSLEQESRSAMRQKRTANSLILKGLILIGFCSWARVFSLFLLFLLSHDTSKHKSALVPGR
jgi:hypothetical protein